MAMYKHGAQHQRNHDPDGHVARWIAGLFGVRGDGIEADVSEENDGRAGQHADRFAGRSRSAPSGCGQRS